MRYDGKPVSHNRQSADSGGAIPVYRLPRHADAALAEWIKEPDAVWSLAAGTLRSRWAVEQHAVPENPDADTSSFPATRDHFRVVVPVTGGMDSTTCWQMAVEAGLDPFPIYVDAGQPYADAERAVAAHITGRAVTQTYVALPVQRYDHLIAGRNLAILVTAARVITQSGCWGEIWFGNLAGESPVVGGDKSSRFLVTAQMLLNALGHDVRIVTPLLGMDKPDIVDWWLARGMIDVLRATRSCFAADAAQCGICQACFRKRVAFAARGMDISDDFAGHDLTRHIAKYEPLMQHAIATNDWSRYSPARSRDTLRGIDRLREWGVA